MQTILAMKVPWTFILQLQAVTWLVLFCTVQPRQIPFANLLHLVFCQLRFTGTLLKAGLDGLGGLGGAGVALIPVYLRCRAAEAHQYLVLAQSADLGG